MKEFIVDLYKKGGGIPTKTRVFAGNAAGAKKIAEQMNPDYRTGVVKEIKERN
jgi:hypothetical protein